MNEQYNQKTNDRKRLEYAIKQGCLPKWITEPKLTTIKKGNEEIDVIKSYGTTKDYEYIFYSNLKVENVKTGTIIPWSCDGIESVDVSTSSDKIISGEIKINPEGCRTTIKEYLLSGLLHRAKVIGKRHPQMREMRDEIIKCYGAGMFEDMVPLTKDDFMKFNTKSPLNKIPLRKRLSPFGFLKGGNKLSFREVWRILTGKNKKIKVTNDYLIGITESKNSNLSKVIKESLINISNDKRKTLNEERNIVKNRFNVLTEGRVIKTNTDKNKFADDVIIEMFEMSGQGIETEVISEGLFDMIGNLFGAAGGGVGQIIKEKVATWLIGKLGLTTDGPLANIIIVAFGNLPLSEYGKLTDCRFVSDLITNSVIEGIALNIEKKKGVDNVFMDLIRNVIGDMFKDSSVENKIAGFLEGMICPPMGGLKEKMSKAEDEIRANVVGS